MYLSILKINLIIKMSEEISECQKNVPTTRTEISITTTTTIFNLLFTDGRKKGHFLPMNESKQG